MQSLTMFIVHVEIGTREKKANKLHVFHNICYLFICACYLYRASNKNRKLFCTIKWFYLKCSMYILHHSQQQHIPFETYIWFQHEVHSSLFNEVLTNGWHIEAFILLTAYLSFILNSSNEAGDCRQTRYFR